MADGKYNLDAIISKAIHRPAITARPELPPLYARIGNESETTIDAAGLKDPTWLAKAQTTYNSPTNVRRLFIGENKVYIQYYQPYISNGKSSGKYWIEFAYTGEDTINNMIDYVRTLPQRKHEAVVNNCKQPNNPTITKTGLGGLSNHWKMSNIEEIYMTPALALSLDNRTLLGKYADHLITILSQNITNKVYKTDCALQMFVHANGSNIKNIRARFPRLRTVAFLTNIDMLMQQPGVRNLRDGLPVTVADLKVTWYKHIDKLGLLNTCCLVYSDVPFEDKNPVLDFAIRSGIYRFDAEVLEKYAESYKSKALEIARLQRDKAQGQVKQGNPQEPTEKSDFEKILDQSFESDGQSVVSAALQLTLSRVKTEDLNKIFDTFTSEGKAKYRQLVGR